MGGVVEVMQPYAYPHLAHQRRHGPDGYADYGEYRPWLEDEFTFRCVYCLKRMVWAPTDIWAIDHLIPRHEPWHPESEYDNLVFACQFCNLQKGPNRVPDPCQVAYGACLQVERDGTVTPLNKHGSRLETVLRLNHPQHVAERLKTIKILSVCARHDRAEFKRLMGFPTQLPDLQRQRPPHNRRPEGIATSYYAMRERGELPSTY